MKPKKRQKLCHNCEGEIDVDVIVCPFCAADLREEKPEQKFASFVSTTQPMHPKEAPEPLYPSAVSRTEAIREEIEEEVKESSGDQKTNVFVPTVLFTLGVQLCVFGLLMLLFSHKGAVILKWDARFWFFYVLASIPFLIFGYRHLSRL